MSEGDKGICEPQRCYREKYWDERDLDQKLEALRKHVRTLHNMYNEFETLLYNLKRHQHGQNGDIVVPLENMFANSCGNARYHDLENTPSNENIGKIKTRLGE
jgi:hypothetical protein